MHEKYLISMKFCSCKLCNQKSCSVTVRCINWKEKSFSIVYFHFHFSLCLRIQAGTIRFPGIPGIKTDYLLSAPKQDKDNLYNSGHLPEIQMVVGKFDNAAQFDLLSFGNHGHMRNLFWASLLRKLVWV